MIRGKDRSVKVPEDFMALQEAPIENEKQEPVFPVPVLEDMFNTDKTDQVKEFAKDLAWFLCRESNRIDQTIPGWSGFNQKFTFSHKETTAIGNMPIIKSPAHEYDTLWTVINKCMGMTQKLCQMYTVITFDEQLYCKAKMLQWARTDHCKTLVVLLGGFHIQMTFSKVIGEHMEDSGLKDVLVESGVYDDTTASNIMDGKLWNRVFRANKLTFKALWICFWPKLKTWAEENCYDFNSDHLEELVNKVYGSLDEDDKSDMIAKVSELMTECRKV